MAPTYRELRTSHYRITLKTWLRGLDKALIAYVAVLQFILTAIATMLIIGLAEGLRFLQQPDTSLWIRAVVIAAWQGSSFVLLRALRDATFMPKARMFFDALPVPPWQKLRSDLLLALLSYSFLWLPVIWAVADPLAPVAQRESAETAVSLAELVALSLCVNLTLLRGASRQAWVVLAAVAVFALAQGEGYLSQAMRLGAAALAAPALWHSYLPGNIASGAPVRKRAWADRLAIGSGLVVPLLTHELRSNLAVRVGAIAATLIACLIVMKVRTSDASSASVVVFVAAMAAVTLYSLSALCRNNLLEKLQLVAGNPAFARRMRPWVYGLPAALFAASLLASWPFDRSGTAPRDALVFSLLYAVGVLGTRLRIQATTWFMPLSCMLALIIMSAML